MDQREIRRGSAYLLHWYGTPQLVSGDAADLPPSWEKLKRVIEDAKYWLDRIYLAQCERDTTVSEIEARIAELRTRLESQQVTAVIERLPASGRRQLAAGKALTSRRRAPPTTRCDCRYSSAGHLAKP